MAFDKALFRQCFCAVSASLAVLSTGAAVGWTSPTLKKLVAQDHVFSKTQASWIAAMHEPGHIIAAVPAGILVSRWGFINCLRFAGIFSVLGWILILIKMSLWVICCARVCFGISMGIAFTVVPLYVGEIASSKLRGKLSVLFQSMIYLGHLIEYIIVPWLTYFEAAAVSLCIPLVFLATTIVMVESPYFLLKNGRYNEAGEAYSKLSGERHLQNIELQLNQMQDMLDESQFTRSTVKEILLSRQHRTVLLIVLALAVTQRFSGMSAVVAYAALTFPNTTSGLNSSQYTILFGSVVFLFTIVSGIFIDSKGRRPLVLLSCAGCCLAEAIASAYYYFYENTNSYTWLPVVVVSCYACFYSIGLGPAVNVAQGELFSPSVKGVSASIVTVVHASSSFVVTKFYQNMRQHAGIFLPFAVFSISCFIGLIFTYAYLPECKQKTLKEVQDENAKNN